MVDPYDWLGVPKPQRPPTYYQLLGLSPNVQESVAIREAAVRQLNKLQAHLTGPHSVSAERLQREITEARDTLLDPEQRRLYDILTPSFDAEPAKPLPVALPIASPPAPTPPPPRMGGSNEWWREVGSEAAPVQPGSPWWKEAVPVEADEPPPPPPKPVRVETPKPIHTHEAPASTLPTMNRPLPKRSGGFPIGLALAGVLIVGGIVVGVVAMNRKPTKTDPTTTVDAGKNQAKELPKTDPNNAKNVDAPPIDLDPPSPPPKDFYEQLQALAFKGHTRAATGVDIARSGSRCISIGEDKTVRIWSIRKEAFVIRHTFTSPGVAIAYAGEDSKIIACDSLSLAVLDANKSSPPKVVESAQGGFMALAASADGSKAFVGISNGDLRLYDTETLKFAEWPSGNNRVLAVSLSADGNTGVSGVADGPVTQWAVGGRSKVYQWQPHERGAIALQLSPDGKKVVTGGDDATATIFDLSKRKEVARIKGHAGAVTGVAWLADGRRVLTASVDGTVRLWNAENGQFLRWSQNLPGKLLSVAVDPSDRFVVVGSSSGSVHVLPLPRVRSEVLAGATATPPVDPLPVPTTKEIQVADQALRNELMADFGYTRSDDMLVLADNLFRRGTQENLTPPQRFALLQAARQLATKADDAEAALKANHALASWFEVDELAEAATLLTTITGRSDPKALLLGTLNTLEDAERAVRPDIVNRVSKRLPEEAAVPDDLKVRVQGAKARATFAEQEFATVTMALTTLKSASTEPNANLVLGRYLCFARQDWTNGLPYLARGSDASLREAANAELAPQTDPKAQYQMGEAWFKMALRTTDLRAKQAIFLRAKTWFEKSGKTATELIDQVKAKARADDVDKANIPPKDAAIPLLGSAVVIRKHFNTLAESAARYEWRLAGEAEFQPQGVRMKAAQPTLTSRFEIGDGTRVLFTITPDGREMKFTVNGEEWSVPGNGNQVQVLLERRGHTLYFVASADNNKALTHNVPLPMAKQGTSTVQLRLNGMPKLTEGALVTAAVVRGPIKFVPPQPE